MNPIHITIIGAGYVGATTSVALAESGHHVLVLEQDIQKVNQLKQGILPFYEEGIEELLQWHLRDGKITFSNHIKECIEQAEIIFITVGTPSLDDGSADLSSIYEVAEVIGRYLDEYKVIVIKSTVPVGTSERVKKLIEEEISKRGKSLPFDMASNPEFLREGKALQDAIAPDRIVVGCETKRAREVMEALYKDTEAPLLLTTTKNAEMIKYASNAFLATKISYINELARLCDKLGADITQVAKGMGYDKRIGSSFLQAGIGYGGSCFPKDVKALCAMAKAEKTSLSILEAVSSVNDTQVGWFLEKVKQHLGELYGKRIAILGLTFKPDTDDIREASSLKIIKILQENKAHITAYDPKGMEHVKQLHPSLTYASSPYEAIKAADAVLIVTEWKEIIDIDWARAKNIMSRPYIFDARNALSDEMMVNLGFHYVRIGKAVE